MTSFLPETSEIDDDLGDLIAEQLVQVENRLRGCVATEDAMASWTASHLLNAGGKRIRPVLTILGGAFGDARRSEVVASAALVELTHLASLYHDDVMDSAPTRRGAQSAHEIWGNNVAILTGDFLFARASALSATLDIETVAAHSHTFERLCLGQLHETVGPREAEDPYAHYLDVLADKTASLIALAGQLGARHGGAGEEIADIMARYGEKVGVAFQLADDVLDLMSDASTSGKRPGTDLREGVPTMPTLLLRRDAASGDAASQTLVEQLDGDLSSDEALDAMVKALREHPCLQEAADLARATAEEATTILQELPDRPARDALMAFTSALVDRGR